MAFENEIKDLKTEVRTTFTAFKEANDLAIEEAEKRGVATAETAKKVEAINADLTEIKKEVQNFSKRSQRVGVKEKGYNERTGEEQEAYELRTAAFSKYLRFGMGENTPSEFSPEEKRALAGTSDTDGQFLVPEDMESNIIIAAANVAEIRPLVQVGTTSRDAVKMGALGRPIVQWGTRGLEIDKQTLNTGGLIIPIKNVRALTLISNDTLDDAAANIVAELEEMFQTAVAEAEDDAFIVGQDQDSPKGILTNAAVQAAAIASGVAADIADGSHNGMDILKQMLYALKKAYRRNATWAMNSTTEGEYRKLKDGEGRYLWDDKLDTAGNANLLGRTVVNPEGMPDIVAGSFPVLLGDFKSGYKVRDRSGLTITRLVERYAEYDQTGFVLKKRVGGGVALAEAFVPLTISA